VSRGCSGEAAAAAAAAAVVVVMDVVEVMGVMVRAAEALAMVLQGATGVGLVERGRGRGQQRIGRGLDWA
jgi:hypothetical protein